ncbi:YeiH family protein [Stieleria sp. TO1_6]|uniref:YeiH family protein n=1 Tax=Stieleria tagensis TaxID=2956795 RepID=UPI00209B959C|nr:putative sulfate exporter family transporter [Stieleria tagensis]MCO8121394.1 YeiH family protein [Stieleria tagensis]
MSDPLDPSVAADSTDDSIVSPQRESTWQQMKTTEDWWAIWCAAALLLVSFLAVWIALPSGVADRLAAGEQVSVVSPLKAWLGKPGSWEENPIDAFYVAASGDAEAKSMYWGVLGALLIIGVLFTIAMKLRGKDAAGFAVAFPVVFALATIAYVLAGQSTIKAYNLEYALWALLVGLIISNTLGTPGWLRPAVLTEFFIKTGLVLLGAEVLMGRLMALGLPGIGVAWVVTPIVLISTYVFGQKVLKIPSKSLNMVISADMSVCGVSAAIATAASCKAKKEELSLAIGLSLSFTVVMMVLLPIIITALGLSPAVGGAWLGGTIDATGAVAVAGATLGEEALEVAVTIKMIQNILIGVTAFLVAVYWVTYVEKTPGAPRPGIGEIWYRFPKFVLGFIAASILFSLLHNQLAEGGLIIDAMIKGSTKTLRGWLFCLAFVCIGLETNFQQLMPYFRGGKPMVLYVCGQTLNLLLTLLMAYLMFEVIFPGTGQ